MKINNIVFNKINFKLIFFYKILQKLDFKIYYLYQNQEINEKEISILKKNDLYQVDLSRLSSISTKDWKNFWIGEINLISDICEKSFSSELKKFLKNKLDIKEEKAVNFFLFENTFYPKLEKAALLEIFSKEKGLSVFISFELEDYFMINNHLLKKIVFPINIFPSFKNMKKIFNIIILLFQKLKKKNQPSIKKKTKRNNRIKLIYLLHDGIKIANNYKNIIVDFKNNKNNLLEKEEILIIDYTNNQANSIYFKIIKLFEIPISPKVFFNTLKTILFLIIKVRSFLDFFLIIKIAISIYGYFKFNNFLKSYPNLKAAFIDHDFLCPKFLIFCLMSNKIQTLSYQERPITVFYNNISFFYDYYFTTSSFFSKQIPKKNNFIVGKIIDCGFYDCDKYNFSSSNFQKFKKKKQKKILFLDFQSAYDQFSRVNDLCESDRSHKKFLYDFIKIARNFPTVKFSISSKGTDYFEDRNFKFFFDKIYRVKNIEIASLTEDETTLNLLEKSDLVVGKPSSIMEKCLYTGKPILIHEYTNNITHQMSEVMDVYDNFFYCNSSNQLINKISIFLNNYKFFIEKVNKEKKKLFNTNFKIRNIIHKKVLNLID
jgi:hypothetical protein